MELDGCRSSHKWFAQTWQLRQCKIAIFCFCVITQNFRKIKQNYSYLHEMQNQHLVPHFVAKCVLLSNLDTRMQKVLKKIDQNNANVANWSCSCAGCWRCSCVLTLNFSTNATWHICIISAILHKSTMWDYTRIMEISPGPNSNGLLWELGYREYIHTAFRVRICVVLL